MPDKKTSEIVIAQDFEASLAAQKPKVDFPMTGVQVLARVCKDEQLAALSCCPGSNSIIDAIADQGIPSWGGHHEATMTAAADGFARMTGQVAACMGEQGPGFVQMIGGMASAQAARSPILLVARNRTLNEEDTEARLNNLADQQGMTVGVKKYGKRVSVPNRVAEYAAWAFRQLKSGVPGPVHLDFPIEVLQAEFKEPQSCSATSTKCATAPRAGPVPTPRACAEPLICWRRLTGP